MTWVAVGLGAAAVAVGTKVGVGISQRSKGKKLAAEAAENRPTFEIPDAVQANVDKAKNQQVVGMAEPVRQQAMRDIDRGQAGAYAASGSRKGGLSGIAGINQQGQDARFGVNAQDAAMMQASQQQKDANIYAQQGLLGQYQAQQWQINEFDPNREMAAQGAAMQGSGMQNIMGGMDTLGSAGISMMGMGGGAPAAPAAPAAAGAAGGAARTTPSGLSTQPPGYENSIQAPAATAGEGFGNYGFNNRTSYSPNGIRSYD